VSCDTIKIPDEVQIPDAVVDKIPLDMPEWLIFVIAGFALAIIIFILVKIGDVIFKVALAVITVVFIYLLISGRVDIPGLSPFFESLAQIIKGWFS